MRLTRLGIGIVGTGRMAARMAQTISRSSIADIVRVASSSRERSERFAQRFGCKGGSLADLLNDPNVSAVYIANANRDHASAIFATLATQRPILCEKPLTDSLESCLEAIERAKRTGTLLMEAVSTPFLPAVSQVIKWGRSRPKIHLDASFGYRVRAVDYDMAISSDAGVVRDRAIYPLTIARLACGPGTVAHATVTREDGIDVDAGIEVRHDNQSRSYLAASLTRTLPNRLALECGDEAIAVPAPLLAARRIRQGSLLASIGEQNPLMRRLYEAVARWDGSARDYGPDPNLPMLNHFVGLVTAHGTESPILSYDVTADVHRWMAAVRMWRHM